MKTEKCMMFHAGLPQVFTRPVAHHVKAYQVFYSVVLEKQKNEGKCS